MPEAPKTGLRLAAAPAAGASTVALATALAAASTDDIVANLSDEHRTGLAAALAPPAPAADAKDGKKGKGKDPNEADPNEKEPDGDEDDKMKAAKAESFAAGQKAANERFAAVAASEHFEGREKAAMKMLGTSMSADEIGGLLADLPKGGDASAEMLAALRGKNPSLGTSADDTGAANAAADHGWGKAQAKAQNLFGHPKPAKVGN